jgi:hypothetical protein
MGRALPTLLDLVLLLGRLPFMGLLFQLLRNEPAA